VYARREVCRLALVAGGSAIVGGLAWEVAHGPVLHHFSPEQRIINPDWREDTGLVNVPWISFAGDPKATGDQSTWERVGIAAISKGSLEGLLAAKSHAGSVPAAAFQEAGDTGKVTSLGSLYNLGTVQRPNWVDDGYAVAFRIGHGAVNVSLGILQPGGVYIGSADTSPFADIKLADLARQYEDVPVLRG